MTKHYDAMVKPRQYNIRDLVLKRVSLATKDSAYGKLGPNWEGPYRVINYLEALDGWRLEHPWNVEHLKKYYNKNSLRRSAWMTLTPTDYWVPLVVYVCYLLALVFSSSILCLLVFEFLKKHWLLACAMFMDDVINKVHLYIKQFEFPKKN